MRPKPIILVAALAVTASGCGDEPERAPTTTVALPAETTAAATTTSEPPAPAQPPGREEAASVDPRGNARERQAEATVREYVAALDARDGAGACALLAPGALEGFELPEPRGGCAPSLEASIGYRDPRGLPVWAGARVAAVRSIEVAGDAAGAKVVATVITRFADRDEPSIEDDVLYLTRSGGPWLVAKPSATLYRAVGIAEVPPSVLSPPESKGPT